MKLPLIQRAARQVEAQLDGAWLTFGQRSWLLALTAGGWQNTPVPDTDTAIAKLLFALLEARAAKATLCPSDVARALAPGDELAWRALMPDVRRVAAGLAVQGRLRVTRRGLEVDAESPGGPIRLGRP